MKSFTLFIALCLLASCERKEQIPPPAGLKSPDLPTAIHSRKLGEGELRYIEIVISEDKTEIFHEGKPVNTTTTPEELHDTLKKLREDNDMMGYSSPLIISAPASTPFTAIEGRINSALEIGIYQILYLVNSNQTAEPMVASTDLVCLAHSEIDPYYLHITADGQIYSGTGETKFLINSDKTDQQLHQLTEHLEIYSAAAKSLGITSPPCHVHVDPNATYQRVIDVISLTNKFQTNAVFTDRSPEPEQEHYRGPEFVPLPPSSITKPLGLAPK